MKSIAISGSARQNVGKRDAKQLRYEGKVPCVLYGGKEQYHFSASAADLRDLIYTPEAMFVDIDLEGRNFRAIMQDIQFHTVSDVVLHIRSEERRVGKKGVRQCRIRWVPLH